MEPYVDTLMIHGRDYLISNDEPPPAWNPASTGTPAGTITCTLSTQLIDPSYHLHDGDATFLPVGQRSTSFRRPVASPRPSREWETVCVSTSPCPGPCPDVGCGRHVPLAGAAARPTRPPGRHPGVALMGCYDSVVGRRRRNMTWSPTSPSVGWSNVSGTVARISKPSDSHSATAVVLVSTTALNCMP